MIATCRNARSVLGARWVRKHVADYVTRMSALGHEQTIMAAMNFVCFVQ